MRKHLSVQACAIHVIELNRQDIDAGLAKAFQRLVLSDVSDVHERHDRSRSNDHTQESQDGAPPLPPEV
ncbi:hypothetical protein D3C85_1185720 [compost metagenome]